MAYASNLSPLLLMCIVGLTSSVYAQQSPDSAKSQPNAAGKSEAAASSSTSQSTSQSPSQSTSQSPSQPDATAAAAGTAAPAEPPPPEIHAVFIPAAPNGSEPPSADFVKKAKEEHWHAKLKQGVYLFCKTDADIGTRFTTEKCITENELKSVIARADEQRQAFQQRGGCSGGGACGGSK